MTTLIATYDADGSIVDWRYDPADADEYDPADDELVVDDEEVDHRDLAAKQVDTSVEPPALVDDPNYESPPALEDVAERLEGLEKDHPVARKRVSDEQKASFRSARDDGDLQGQLDIVFEVLTGEQP